MIEQSAEQIELNRDLSPNERVERAYREVLASPGVMMAEIARKWDVDPQKVYVLRSQERARKRVLDQLSIVVSKTTDVPTVEGLPSWMFDERSESASKRLAVGIELGVWKAVVKLALYANRTPAQILRACLLHGMEDIHIPTDSEVIDRIGERFD